MYSMYATVPYRPGTNNLYGTKAALHLVSKFIAAESETLANWKNIINRVRKLSDSSMRKKYGRN